MSRARHVSPLMLALVGLAPLPNRMAQAQTAAVPIVEPKADVVLRQMSQLLAGTTDFSFTNYSLTDEVTPTGQKIQYAKKTTINVRRPDGIYAVVIGDREKLTVVYDGKTIALYDPTENQYAITPMPNTIDLAVDTLAVKYGIVAPVADLLFSNPYESFSGRLEAGVYLGEHDVNGVPCHHLAFRQPGADWQIWIDSGQRPLPRKMVITYKTLPGEPQFIAFLNDWTLGTKAPAERFTFTPPNGAKKAELTPLATEPTTQPKP